MADQMPTASFLGVDSSKVQLAVGQQAISAAELKNVELRLQDILDFSASEGKFDYIIAHGVYSWVPGPVRERILAICAEHLTENGVAYISYNARPGWNLRESLRQMMLYHTKGFSDPAVRVQQARALVAFLADAVPAENTAFSSLLKSELALMTSLSDNYLLHDILGVENTPFYFHEFIGQAAAHGLQYLSEPSIAEMLTANFPDKVHQTLSKLDKQIVAQEQYMDFLRNRSFRQTLLCRSSVKIRRALNPNVLGQFSFRSSLVQATGPVELVAGVQVAFATVGGLQITSADPFVKAAALLLTETRGVAAISYQALLEGARARSRPFLGAVPPNRDQIDEATLQTNLLNLLAKGLLEVHSDQVNVSTDVPEKPRVSAFARYQAFNARLITNPMHQSVPADLVARYVIAACDGTRTRAELVDALIERVKEGKLQVNEGAAKVTDEKRLAAVLAPRVDSALSALALAGFFAG